ncbi:MAG: hypothetical protein C4521_04740 [Actinobacteria bacterium]|nr:MAG: hypothetical protein C4521_04740 [Actinomycetota bacterium]
MSEPIVIVDVSEILEGKLEELKAAAGELAEFVEANEPRALAYDIYLDGSHMTVLQAHPDSQSAEFHMEVAGPAFRKFTELLKLERIDVYGGPSARLLSRLRRKAEMLGDGTVVVHGREAGFFRLAAAGRREVA